MAETVDQIAKLLENMSKEQKNELINKLSSDQKKKRGRRGGKRRKKNSNKKKPEQNTEEYIETTAVSNNVVNDVVDLTSGNKNRRTSKETIVDRIRRKKQRDNSKEIKKFERMAKSDPDYQIADKLDNQTKIDPVDRRPAQQKVKINCNKCNKSYIVYRDQCRSGDNGLTYTCDCYVPRGK